ncbi:DUF6807 domain-containing protein [Streptomyces scopuliridis]
MTTDETQLLAVHTIGHEVTVRSGQVELARYVYTPDPDPFESPKPYLHPLRTLAGDTVTDYRPHDHRWHEGLQLTATDVSGHNLWGGNTFVAGTGYTKLDNVGAMHPEGAVAVDDAGDRVTISHALRRTSAQDEQLSAEERRLVIHGVDRSAGLWLLDWHSEVRSETAQPLHSGSPATRGLPGSGYTGLWWRGPQAFTGGRVTAPGGEVDPADFRGKPAPWLAFTGDHDGADRSSTLVFCHGPANAGHAAHWFVRASECAAVNPSWAFHETFRLKPGQSFFREYRIAVVDGAWDHERIAQWHREQVW